MRYPSHIRGDIAELHAAMQLIRNGSWVARSMHSGSCPFDLVALSEHGELSLIDIKTLYRRRGSDRTGQHRYRGRTDLQRELGIQVGYVDLETGSVNFSGEPHKLIKP